MTHAIKFWIGAVIAVAFIAAGICWAMLTPFTPWGTFCKIYSGFIVGVIVLFIAIFSSALPYEPAD